jgi:phosphoglucomutase
MTPSSVHALAGRPAPPELLVNVPRLLTAYYTERPDPSLPAQRIVFGTSGHRGSSLAASFNEAHILSMTQAICLYRRAHGIDGPLFLGWDTHALSEPARVSALEVLAANGVDVMVDARDDFTPTPVVSWAILAHNRGRSTGLADGIVITPSHNPPEYGGLKYDPPSGGPADTAVTVRHILVLNGRLSEIQTALNGFLSQYIKRAEELKTALEERFEQSAFYSERIRLLLSRARFHSATRGWLP